jgi:Asp-tRNA(Asn)/Glu-tRNA(Gln) amidotransferase A subunit family amidase
MSNELYRLTATEAARQIDAGTLKPADLLEACLDRIAAREPVIHAFAHHDPAAARAVLPKPGKLHGIPIGVKDVFDTEDAPSSYGSPIWAGWRPRADAAAVAWTREAGGVVIGKTVTTEFATRHPGPTVNPVVLGHTPGGSSSGSAAGVADGMFPVAFGSQTAGSVIRPAAFCGVVGYKPTYGTISRIGTKIMSDSLDTVGVLARSVADCAFFAGAVSGRDLGDPETNPGRAPRIGICRSPTWELAAPETCSLLERVEAAVARGGAHVEQRELPELFNALVDAHPIVMNAESARAIGWELAHHAERISEGLRERMAFGLGQTDAALAGAYDVFDRTQQAFPEATSGLDVLLTPSACGEAPAGIEWTGDPAFNFIWTSLHVPCVTVPAGTGPNGLPLGIQIVGRRGEDRAVLAWARWVQAAIG